MEQKALDLLQKLLEENNLSIELSPLQTRFIQDGGVIIEKPKLIVRFVKEEKTEK